jgi:hypothetical protein
MADPIQTQTLRRLASGCTCLQITTGLTVIPIQSELELHLVEFQTTCDASL